MKKVVVCQHRLLHYRIDLFEQLRARCVEKGITLELLHGQASAREAVRKDEGHLPWAHKVMNRFREAGGVDLIWQPFPRQLRDADLIVIMQENRILSNYPLMLSRLWSKRKIAYWGHGANFQSDAPSGLRERWKQLLLKQVDWWFAYTQATVDILLRTGYPSGQITCLNNAIDSSKFKAQLAAVSDEQILAEKNRLGIDPGAPIGIFCGSLYPDKKLDLMIAAADRVQRQRPGFALLILGDGPSMPQMRAAAAARPWLHLLGIRRGMEKALYFRMSDMMLNPGLVGLHIVDAFCGGLVLISTRSARHSPEVIYLQDGVNGALTEDSAEAYSATVLQFINDPLRLDRMKAEALAASNFYSLENMVQRFADGIEMALAQPPMSS